MTQPSPARSSFGAKRRAARLISLPFALLALGAVLFEEWVWRSSAQALGRLSHCGWVQRGERRLAQAPVWVAALAFIAPGALLFPAKLFGIWLIAQERPALGVAVFILAKVAGAAAVARVYALTEPALRSIGWINASIDFALGLKTRLSAHLLSSAWLREANALLRRWRSRLSQAKASWASKRMGAALRKEKRKAQSPSPPRE